MRDATKRFLFRCMVAALAITGPFVMLLYVIVTEYPGALRELYGCAFRRGGKR